MRNRKCGKQLNISWNGVNLTHGNLPVYIGVTLDRTLSYKSHIEKTNKKVGTRKQHHPKTKNLTMGSDSNHTQVVRSSAMLLSCRVKPARCGSAPPTQRNWMRHWMKPAEWSQAVWCRQIPTVCLYSPESLNDTSGERWQVVRNGHSKLRTKDTHSKDIWEWCHAWNRGRASSNALSLSTRRRAMQRTTRSPGRQWTPYRQCWRTPPSWHRESLDNLDGTQPVAYTGWPVESEHVKVGIFQRTKNLWLWIRQTMQHRLVCPMMDTACMLSTWTDNG